MAHETDWPAARWIDDTDLDDERPRRTPPTRRRLLLVGAAVPWAVVVLLLMLPQLSGDDPATGAPTSAPPAAEGAPAPTADPPGGSLDVDPEVGERAPPAAHRLTDELELVELRGAFRVEHGDELAATVAVAVARAWLTGMDPPLAVPGLAPRAAPRYAEHLAVEAVERISGDAAVVTILAIVLEGEDELHAGLERLAIPIVWDGGHPHPGGEPWPLPAPDLEARTLATTPVTDPDLQLAAVAALEAAGFAEVELLGLGSAPTGPAVARIDARGPDGEPLHGAVWLRHHLDGFAVSGTTLSAHDAGATPTEPGSGGEDRPEDEG